MSKERVPGSHLSWWRLDCLAGHVRFELRNVGANYPFERSHGFPGIKPKSGHRDYSRLSCDVGDTQLGPAAPTRALPDGRAAPARRCSARGRHLGSVMVTEE